MVLIPRWVSAQSVEVVASSRERLEIVCRLDATASPEVFAAIPAASYTLSVAAAALEDGSTAPQGAVDASALLNMQPRDCRDLRVAVLRTVPQRQAAGPRVAMATVVAAFEPTLLPGYTPRPAPPEHEWSFEAVWRQLLVNYQAGRAWRYARPRRDTPTPFQRAALDMAARGERPLRLEISRRGLWRIAGAALANLAEQDLATANLWFDQRPVPLAVVRDTHGAPLELLFYASQTTTPTSATGVYWFTWGGEAGPRAPLDAPRPSAAPPHAVVRVEEAMDDGREYGGAVGLGRTREWWLKIFNRGYGDVCQLRPRLAGWTADGTVAVTLVYGSSSTRTRPLRILTGTDKAWAEGVVGRVKSASLTADIPAEALLRAKRAITVAVPAVDDPETWSSEQADAVAAATFAYDRVLSLAAGPLAVQLDAVSAATLAVTVGDRERAAAWRTEPSPLLVVLPPGTWTLPEDATGRWEIWRSDQVFSCTPEATALQPPAYPDQGADYLVVAPRRFAPLLEPLLALRLTQGMTTALVAAEDCYDWHSGGMMSPQALRQEIRRALTEPTAVLPSYVLLVGDASWDYHARFDPDYTCVLPALAADTGGEVKVPYEMDMVADDGADAPPEAMLGRLPVACEDDLAGLVEKLVAFERTPGSGAWINRALVVYDEYMADGVGAWFRDSLPASTDLRVIRSEGALTEPLLHFLEGGKEVFSMLRTTARMLDIINDGVALMHYVGHGGVGNWSKSRLFLSVNRPDSDVLKMTNTGRYGVLCNWSCLTGCFNTPWPPPFRRCLGEELILHPDRGGIAFWGDAGYGSTNPHAAVAKVFHRALFECELHRLGQAIGYTGLFAAWTSGTDTVRRMALLGDAATRLSLPRRDLISLTLPPRALPGAVLEARLEAPPPHAAWPLCELALADEQGETLLSIDLAGGLVGAASVAIEAPTRTGVYRLHAVARQPLPALTAVALATFAVVPQTAVLRFAGYPRMKEDQQFEIQLELENPGEFPLREGAIELRARGELVGRVPTPALAAGETVLLETRCAVPSPPVLVQARLVARDTIGACDQIVAKEHRRAQTSIPSFLRADALRGQDQRWAPYPQAETMELGEEIELNVALRFEAGGEVGMYHVALGPGGAEDVERALFYNGTPRLAWLTWKRTAPPQDRMELALRVTGPDVEAQWLYALEPAPGYDLDLDPSSLRVEPACLFEGEACSVTVAVRNTGVARSPAAVLRVYDDARGAALPAQGPFSRRVSHLPALPPLEAGENRELRVTYYPSVQQTTATLVLRLETTDGPPEAKTANNEVAAALAYRPNAVSAKARMKRALAQGDLAAARAAGADLIAFFHQKEPINRDLLAWNRESSLRDLGWTYLVLERYDEAEQLLATLRAHYPDDEGIHFLAACARWHHPALPPLPPPRLGRELRDYALRGYGREDGSYQLAMTRLRTHDLPGAQELFRRSVTMLPYNDLAWRGLLETAWIQQDLPAVEALLVDHIARSAVARRSWLDWESGLPYFLLEEAVARGLDPLETARKAWQRDRRSFMASMRLAAAQAQAGDARAALKTLDSLAWKSAAPVWKAERDALRAMLLYDMGQTHMARVWLRRALMADPETLTRRLLSPLWYGDDLAKRETLPSLLAAHEGGEAPFAKAESLTRAHKWFYQPEEGWDSSYWRATVPATLELDLGTPRRIARVDVVPRSRAYGARQVHLRLYSPQQRAYVVPDYRLLPRQHEGDPFVFRLTPVTTRKLRVEIVEGSANAEGRAYLGDVRVFEALPD